MTSIKRNDWRTEERTFVVRTAARMEVSTAVEITAKTGIQVFMPVRQVQISHARKITTESRALFPNYIFPIFVEAEKRYGAIRHLRGKPRLLCDIDGIPMPVPATVIADLRRGEIAYRAQSGEIRTGWAPGDVFKLPVGRYADFEARYIGEVDGQVSVIVTLFGQDFVHTLSAKDVPPNHYLLESDTA